MWCSVGDANLPMICIGFSKINYQYNIVRITACDYLSKISYCIVFEILIYKEKLTYKIYYVVGELSN